MVVSHRKLNKCVRKYVYCNANLLSEKVVEFGELCKNIWMVYKQIRFSQPMMGRLVLVQWTTRYQKHNCNSAVYVVHLHLLKHIKTCLQHAKTCCLYNLVKEEFFVAFGFWCFGFFFSFAAIFFQWLCISCL